MVEIDTYYPHHVKKSWDNNSGTPVHFLMTQERTQVLDLLVHLIANTTGSIIVCGPEGVGKTSLLKVLPQHDRSDCVYCFIEGTSEISLDKIQEHLSKALKQDETDNYNRTLSSVHQARGTSRRKIAVIIDNAGTLMPGLISAVIRNIADKPHLRVIFALTHDQLHLKYKSDQVIEDCHIVEIPPLSEEQCGQFLQHLSTKFPVGISANAYSDGMIADIYRRTHGIPAGIISEFSGFPQRKHEENPTKILVMAVVVLVGLALSVQWLSSRQTFTEPEARVESVHWATDINLDGVYLIIPMMEPKVMIREQYVLLDVDEKLQQASQSGLEISSAASDYDSEIMSESASVSENENKSEPHIIRQTISENQEISEDLRQSDEEKAPDNEKIEVTSNENDASVGLSSQTEDQFTLQLMVLSKQQSIQDVMKKYPTLKQDLRYVRRLINGKEKFVLLYGRFSDAEAANKSKQALPPEFQKSLTRKISSINNELNLKPAHE